ncbi:MAG: hypothetical protein KDA85_12600 [Planctomycetaceae bacterium]|nr:hypothetical protein [Planctomycetaceae bacterium]
MRFYYVYKALAHPENNDYVAPLTLQERLLHIEEAKRRTGTKIPWICDSMDNDLKHAMGDRPNSEFILDPDGRIIVARDWSSPDDLRADLSELIGTPQTTTRITDLDMQPVPPAHAAPTGIVPRLQLPEGMQPLKVEAVTRGNNEPFYVKLRVEAEPSVLRSGEGKLYLGFMLDPLYHVHWNNDAMPVVFEIVDTTGIQVSPRFAEAAAVDAPADADPREFLLDTCSFLIDPNSSEPQQITVKVRYFACDDAQTFCKPVSQTYVITLQRDRDGGSRRPGGFRNQMSRQRTSNDTQQMQPEASFPNRIIPGQRRATPMPPTDAELMRRRMQRRRQLQRLQQ